MGMRLEISRSLLLRTLRSVQVPSFIDGKSGPPDEKCGILLGRDHRITRLDWTRNVAADPFTTFEIDPGALIKAYRAERRPGGLAVLGFAHTHPVGESSPSIRDADMAAPDGRIWLIAARDGVRLWRAVANGQVHGRFDPVAFDLRIGKRVEPNQNGVRLG
jgi:desampylase